jgi:hypothetical protein
LGQPIPHFKDSFAATATAHLRGWPPVSKKIVRRSTHSTFSHWFLIFGRFLRLAQRGTREMARNRLGPAALALQVCSPHDGCDKKRRVSHENGYNIIGGG